MGAEPAGGVMGQGQPFFSIVVPTYARPRQLAACLQSLSCLDYPRDRFKVIVVDDGSENRPDAVVASLCDQIDVTLLTQLNAGPAAANAGAARAKGELLAFTDDDCAPAPDWLPAPAARVAKTPDHLVGGRTLNSLPETLWARASQLFVAYLHVYYNADPDQAGFFASNNMSLAADRFRAIGGFDTTFPDAAGEDREFCDRWSYHGYRMTYAPEALIYHAHALTFRSFWRQHLNYGRGAFRFHRVRAQRNQGRLRIEPVWFYLNLLRYPFLQAQSWRAPLLAALLVMSQVANATGFFWERAKRTAEMAQSAQRYGQ